MWFTCFCLPIGFVFVVFYRHGNTLRCLVNVVDLTRIIKANLWRAVVLMQRESETGALDGHHYTSLSASVFFFFFY